MPTWYAAVSTAPASCHCARGRGVRDQVTGGQHGDPVHGRERVEGPVERRARVERRGLDPRDAARIEHDERVERVEVLDHDRAGPAAGRSSGIGRWTPPTTPPPTSSSSRLRVGSTPQTSGPGTRARPSSSNTIAASAQPNPSARNENTPGLGELVPHRPVEAGAVTRPWEAARRSRLRMPSRSAPGRR